MPELSINKRISEELIRISVFFDKVDANQKALVKPLLENAAFMKVTLEDLQKIINTEGVTEEYQNGLNQRGMKQSAALQSYNALLKNFTAVIKQLSNLLPPEEKKIALSSLHGWKPPEQTAEEIEEQMRREEERQRKINEEIAKAAEWQRQQRERARTDK